jgi:hypothetical protein
MTNLQEEHFSNQVLYWLKGEDWQNFGDFLSEYLLEKLFLQTARQPKYFRIIGSILHDSSIPAPESGDNQSEFPESVRQKKLVTWGCGIRETGGVSAEKRKATDTLSVRGPLSASEMCLGANVPMGDPALLLPAIYAPAERQNFLGKTVLVPHFLDVRTDEELLGLTEADAILRPNIKPSLYAVEQFIDALHSAQFILSSSLHGAIVAAAYGRPFAYWDSGNIDIPAKWRDFSESANIPAVFVKNVAEGVSHYERDIAPKIRLPSLWESLAAAPFMLRPDSLLKIFVSYADTEIGEGARRSLQRIIDAFERQYEHFRNIANESIAIAEHLEGYARLLSEQAAAAERNRDDFEARLNLVEVHGKQTELLLREMTQARAELMRQQSYLETRSILETLLFRADGRPTKFLRRVLYHNNGKPRGIFRRYIVDSSGNPRGVFRHWMTSPAYLALPHAVRPLPITREEPTGLRSSWRNVICVDALDEADLDALMERIRAEVSTTEPGVSQ